ncbi:MAG TPA: hypothetical protein DHW02_05935 [Ktedonobacter sp.]|nr:hypothetical protein [Ktedonobacter sp.]
MEIAEEENMNVPPEANTSFNDDKRTHLLREAVPTVPLHHTIQNRNPSNRSRWVLPVVFLAGVIAGIVILVLFLLAFSFDRSVTQTPITSSSGSITIEISRAYMTSFISKQLKSSGLPGSISNVQVVMAQNNLMTVSGDDQVAILGLGVTKRITLILQLSVVSCQLHVTVIHADLDGISVTGFVALFENELNRQIQSQQSGFPSGFTYCLSSTQTTTDNMLLKYSATSNS